MVRSLRGCRLVPRLGGASGGGRLGDLGSATRPAGLPLTSSRHRSRSVLGGRAAAPTPGRRPPGRPEPCCVAAAPPLRLRPARASASAPSGIDLVNRVHEGALYRVIGGREVRIAAGRGRRRGRALRRDHPAGGREAARARARPGLVLRLRGREPVLAAIVPRLAGLRPPLLPDPFESLVTSISAQQVSLRSALAIRNRLVERFGEPGMPRVRLSPARAGRVGQRATPELLASASRAARPSTCSASPAPSSTSTALAAASDEEVRATLTAMRGLGPWTAEWFLARHLARPRAWPVGDLVLRQGGRSLLRFRRARARLPASTPSRTSRRTTC